jgi:serine/threonine-protein kinase RsbT
MAFATTLVINPQPLLATDEIFFETGKVEPWQASVHTFPALPRSGPRVPRSTNTRKKDEVRIRISSSVDIVTARQQGRELADNLGFGPTDLAIIATAISELARNIVLYAHDGEIVLRSVEGNDSSGILVTALDDGPGIPNVEDVVYGACSASGGLGLGLPGVRRLMDEFDIFSETGRGTTVTAKKWKR